ncbi:hypothetical protein Gotur_015822 [Gossypium turneri]
MGLPCVLEAFTSIFETGSISNKCCGDNYSEEHSNME